MAKATGATVTLSPDPARAWGTIVTAYGAGAYPSESVYVNVHTPFSLVALTCVARADGAFALQFGTLDPGSYEVDFYQYQRKRLLRIATAYLSVPA